MKKILSILFLSFFWFNTSHGDTPFDGVQINCYEKSGYFEIRRMVTSNLNKFGSWEDENLISLHIPGEADKKSYGSIVKECKFLPHRAIENEIKVKVILYPYCRMLSKIKNTKNKCINVDAKFDIWHIDNNGEKLIFDKAQFFIFEKTAQHIERIEYLPKDLYFVVHLKSRKKRSENYNLKETILWLPGSGSISSEEYEYPVTNKSFQKIYE